MNPVDSQRVHPTAYKRVVRFLPGSNVFVVILLPVNTWVIYFYLRGVAKITYESPTIWQTLRKVDHAIVQYRCNCLSLTYIKILLVTICLYDLRCVLNCNLIV